MVLVPAQRVLELRSPRASCRGEGALTCSNVTREARRFSASPRRAHSEALEGASQSPAARGAGESTSQGASVLPVHRVAPTPRRSPPPGPTRSNPSKASPPALLRLVFPGAPSARGGCGGAIAATRSRRIFPMWRYASALSVSISTGLRERAERLVRVHVRGRRGRAVRRVGRGRSV